MYRYGDKEISSEDALLILNHRLTDKDFYYFAEDIKIALAKAKSELSFRCSKKVKEHEYDKSKDGEFYFNRICPTCGDQYTYSKDKWIKFCPFCGQKLEF